MHGVSICILNVLWFFSPKFNMLNLTVVDELAAN